MVIMIGTQSKTLKCVKSQVNFKCNVLKMHSFTTDMLSKQNIHMSTKKACKIVWKSASSLQFDTEMTSRAGHLH